MNAVMTALIGLLPELIELVAGIVEDIKNGDAEGASRKAIEAAQRTKAREEARALLDGE